MALKNRGLRGAGIAVLLYALPAAGWDSRIHPGIVRAALSAIPAEDRLRESWGDEVWRLQQYVQLGDWVNAVAMQREQWHVGGETLELSGVQFYANDFLIFPGVPRPFQHAVPDVKGTYRPFFLRALQAMRMENPENAARWVGSLLHFVTDSGSPPHTIGAKGADHTRMESGFDPALIDLTGYRARALGETPEAALQGFLERLDGLIAFSAVRGRQMLPYAASNDRAKLDGPALESAAETARVAADTIHTLVHLAALPGALRGASLTASVSAPGIEGMENLPAKLVILGTAYSTLSAQSLPEFHAYCGVFSLREIPPGTYSVAVERVGSQPLRIAPLVFKAGENVRVAWALQPPEVAGNLAMNPTMDLRWVTREAPDGWHFDSAGGQWISGNIPVVAAGSYRVGCERKRTSAAKVELQWMSHAWEAMKAAPLNLDSNAGLLSDVIVQAPAGAIFARFVIHSPEDPSAFMARIFMARRTDVQGHFER